VKCTNTDHKENVRTFGREGPVANIVLTDDFENTECSWCEACCTVDQDMVEGPLKEIVRPEYYTLSSWLKYEQYGEVSYLVNFDVTKAKEGDEFVIAWEGGEKVLTVKY
jgi:hypothetical protein